MVNNQKELTLQNLYDVVIRIDNKLDSSFGILSNRIQDLDNKINSGFERVETSINNVENRLDRVETRLEKIELSTPRELEKRIMVVEEDSDLHDSYFRGIRTTLQVV